VTATQREIELATLAYNAYVPSDPNILPTGSWPRQSDLFRADPATGFSASVYKNGSELVIAFRGTDDPKIVDFLEGNIPAAAGFKSAQVTQAIQLVAGVLAANPSATACLESMR
jgi:hypothetical protein